MSKENIAFIGLGIMGSKMAVHLVKAGYKVSVYDIVESAADALVKDGAVRAASVIEAVRNADIAITVLPDVPQVEEVICKSGLLEHMPSGGVLIDMSTTAVSGPERFAALLEQKGIGFVDAPVTGGEAAAASAKLSIFAGGDEKNFNRVLPILNLMGARVMHMGGVGTGQMAKTCNQVIRALTLQAVCEGLILASKSNMDMGKLVEAMKGGAGDSFMLDYVSKRVIDGDFKPGFKIDLEQKDLRNALAAADDVKVPLPALALAHQLFRSREAAGGGQKEGNQALYLVYENLAAGN